MNIGIVIGLIKALAPGVDPEIIEQAVMDWLDDHPEATTTVQDGSITEAKLAQDVLADLAEIEGLKEAIENQPEVKSTDASGVDLDLADDDGYVVARFKDGNIKTKNFDSSMNINNTVQNPYHDVLFADDTKVAVTTHDHCLVQATVDALTSKGVGALAISNYYPSDPLYPLSEFGLTAPTGVVEIPNAEHHDFTDSYMHMNSIGSTFSSGKAQGETPIGINDTWQHGIIKMKRELLYADGGGMTINHVHRTGLTDQQMMEYLDFDEAVLGIEIYNQDAEVDLGKGWALDSWDAILQTGRRCWGFAVPDHYAQTSAQNWQGKIVLFVPDSTQENILKAIRKGAFYAQIKHTSLALTNMVVNGHSVTITVSESATIKTIIDGSVADTTTGTTKTINVPNGATYVRFEVSTENDAIYTNPIMFKVRGHK